MRVRPRTPYLEVAFTLNQETTEKILAFTRKIRTSTLIPRIHTNHYTIPLLRAPMAARAPWPEILTKIQQDIPLTHQQFRLHDIETVGHSLTLSLQRRKHDTTLAATAATACAPHLLRHQVPPPHHFGDIGPTHIENIRRYGDPDTATSWHPRICVALATPTALVSRDLHDAFLSGKRVAFGG